MRIFKKGNWNKQEHCPICESNDDEDFVLIGVNGTQSGNNIQAKLVHVKCLNPIIDLDNKFLFQKI